MAMLKRSSKPCAMLKKPAKTPSFDPRRVRLSEHFLLSDFLGNHSVYSKGFANDFNPDAGMLANGKALAAQLEKIMEVYGPLTISYGAIGPALSNKIVRYQDPAKPSHHLWNLGAAADILVHEWIAGTEGIANSGLCFPDGAENSPIALAHAIEDMGVPYSRMITYSESPYICLAVSATEETPRKAFYENRYRGTKNAKPDYHQYGTQKAKNNALWLLQDQGLEVPWEGAGYPTYHGGGFKQYQHMRVSKYTMVSDWLFDLQSISNGDKNIPSMQLESVQNAFAAAGIAYDKLLWIMQDAQRFSIVAGYVSHMNRSFDPANDWRTGDISFDIVPPSKYTPELATSAINGVEYWLTAEEVDGLVRVHVSVPLALDAE